MDQEDNYKPETIIKEVHADLNQPDRFAKIFCAAAESQKCIDDALRMIVKRLIETDAETREQIKKYIHEVETTNKYLFFRKIGFCVWTVFVSLIGGAIVYLFK